MKEETEEGELGFRLTEAKIPKAKVEMTKRRKMRRNMTSLIGRDGV